MNIQWKRAFYLAIILHFAFVISALFIGWISHWQKEPEVMVFELIPDSGPQPQSTDNLFPEIEEVQEAIKVKPVESLREIPEIPDFQTTPEKAPEPAPVPKKVSYEEWAKSRELPERVQRVQTKKTSQAELKTIQTDVRERLANVDSSIRISGVNMLAPVSTNELQAYLSRLREEIQSYFNPTSENLSAETRFDVSISGAILNPRIIASSGNSRFDNAALAALRRAKPLGSPPGGQAYTFDLTFRGN